MSEAICENAAWVGFWWGGGMTLVTGTLGYFAWKVGWPQS